MSRASLVVSAACFILIGGVLGLLFSWQGAEALQAAAPGTGVVPLAANPKYVVIGWNDLGMHCISPRFKEMAILPPFNTLMVQVIRKGDPPQIVTTGVNVRYSIVGNTTVSGKTDFWKYDSALFGVDLPKGTGLTGNRLAGWMTPAVDHFEATGIPVLPYSDTMVWQPYQKAYVRVKDAFTGKLLTATYVVLPVSNEMNCKKCHKNGGDASVGIRTPTVEGNILTRHDINENTNLMGSRPVLCAGCHSDNALGTPGSPGVSSLSKAMHVKHSSLGPDTPTCYDCHPGRLTQCNRSAIDGMGRTVLGPNCEACHGTLIQMADALNLGKEPWLQEPACVQCHDAKYSTGTTLYRNSKGHGGLYCTACHNSPHAWWPSRRAADNYQPKVLQGEAGPIGKKCTACHITNPGGENPHDVIIPAGVRR